MQEEKTIEPEIELWELVGDRWTLPIQVRFEEQHAVVSLARIPLLAAQKSLALAELEPFRNGAVFAMTREQLNGVARKSKFGNPEDVVEWRRTIAPALHFPKHDGVDAFLDFVCNRGPIHSRATMSAIYASLCAAMLEWLLMGRKLPLCFATIYPLLYRKNWKEIVHQKYVKKGWKGDEGSLITVENVLGLDMDQAARKSMRVATCSLNLVHEKMFADAANEYEHALLSRYNFDRARYWKAVRGRIKRQVENAKRCYAEYSQAVRQKSLAFFESDTSGPRQPYRRKKPYGGDGKLYSLSHLPYWRGKRAEQGKCGAVARKNDGVPAVSGVQPATPDVRDTRENVPE